MRALALRCDLKIPKLAAQTRATFTKLDLDGNGTLDRDELNTLAVRLLHRPEELEPDGLCPVCRLEVGYECFSICCDRCDNIDCGTCSESERRRVRVHTRPRQFVGDDGMDGATTAQS